ncbi:TERF1-interacting nuclear factor 2 [Aplochiton taeniatus]
MEILEGLDSSLWVSDDLETMSSAEPWRLRAVAAEALTIVRAREVRLFERVMEIMDATYRLLPTLVSAIKHMKILFGLKTMVIMWMLREDQGILNIVTKTLHFFPSKLPQYQDLSSSQEMFHMRKTQQDFKTLAQTLAMDKAVCEAYIKDQMEKQYGEHYAQKLEDRLTHYLQQLEAVLPRDTYIDQLLMRKRPMANEEELLVKFISCDVTSKAETLKRLMHCGTLPAALPRKTDQHIALRVRVAVPPELS